MSKFGIQTAYNVGEHVIVRYWPLKERRMGGVATIVRVNVPAGKPWSYEIEFLSGGGITSVDTKDLRPATKGEITKQRDLITREEQEDRDAQARYEAARKRAATMTLPPEIAVFPTGDDHNGDKTFAHLFRAFDLIERSDDPDAMHLLVMDQLERAARGPLLSSVEEIDPRKMTVVLS